MRPDTVGGLRDLLADVPDYWPLAIRIVVGGDLGTDDVDLVDVLRLSNSNGPYVALEPAADYNVAELVDNGLAAFHAIEQAEQLGNGYLRYTRDEAGNIILDHVDATRVVILDPAKPLTYCEAADCYARRGTEHACPEPPL